MSVWRAKEETCMVSDDVRRGGRRERGERDLVMTMDGPTLDHWDLRRRWTRCDHRQGRESVRRGREPRAQV